MSFMQYKDVLEALNEMAEHVATELLENPKRSGKYVTGKCNGKVSVHISGSSIGLVGFWGNQIDKQGGTLIDLIGVSMGMDWKQATTYAKTHFLGISDREFTEEEKRQWANRKKQQEKRNAQREDAASKEKLKKVEDVRSLWRESVSIHGTPAEAYLNRRICEHNWPQTLRYHPSMHCGSDNKKHPALVAAVQGVDGKVIAIWRIFLNPDGTNLVIDGQKVKLGFGPSSGGVVRFGPVAETWNMGEGIESTLAAMAFSGFKGSWAASLSTSGMRGFDTPNHVKKIILWRDNDYAKFRKENDGILPSAGIAAGDDKILKLKEYGIETAVMDPPEGLDWQDVWKGVKRGG